ncbi:MAG: alpha/beta hydrolase [Bifidobacterium scardovii]|nr:alpha/beta hydrolase [Bifidobacterium scardovii]MDK6349117.1 alpha/beta hydrolase [Bifidobacterium scardovii]MDU8981168.1 alpha/beta hydrolase [Bifidobacterium scardovii]
MIGCGAAAALAGGVCLTAESLFSFALDTKAKRSMFRQPPDNGQPQQPIRDADECAAAADWFASSKQPVTLASDDGLQLHAWLFDPDCVAPKPHLYAICCHGYTGEPAEMAKWAHRYAKLGFTVLVPAQRAHELSEGRYVGMGWLERNDLLGWIRLITDSDGDARILLHGNSMGAATVMMAAGDPRLPRNVAAAIEDCGYASVAGQFEDTARAMFHLPRPVAAMLVRAAGLVCRRRAGYGFAEASCTRMLRHATIPMLFIHGGADTFVSPRFLEANYRACASLDREKLLVPGADHTMSASTAPDLYWRKVTGFVRRVFAL